MERENIMALADSYMNRYAEDYPFTKDTIFAAYIEGASRANYEHAKVWHDASEEPAGDYWVILCEDDSGNCFDSNKKIVVEFSLNWQRFTEKVMLKRWAYIFDLLPKGGDV